MMAETTETTIAVLCEKVDSLKEDMSIIKKKLDNKYITKEQFEPVRNVVYGLVGLLCTGVVVAIIRMVLVG